jgi:hypothetical protein
VFIGTSLHVGIYVFGSMLKHQAQCQRAPFVLSWSVAGARVELESMEELRISPVAGS